MLPFVSRDDTWVYAQFVVPAAADAWLVPVDGAGAMVQFRQVTPTVADDWTVVSGESSDGVAVGRAPTARTYLLRLAPPGLSHVVLDLLLFEPHGGRRERLVFSHRGAPDGALTAIVGQQLAAARLVDAVRAVADAWGGWPRPDGPDVVEAAVRLAREAGRPDVAEALARARPGPLAAAHILELARSPRRPPGGAARPAESSGRRSPVLPRPETGRYEPQMPGMGRRAEPPTDFTPLPRMLPPPADVDDFEDNLDYDLEDDFEDDFEDDEPPRAVVNTGFAQFAASWEPCDPGVTLQAGTRYLFWFSVESPVAQSIEVAPAGLPSALPTAASLAVALFTFPGEIEVDDRNAVGLLRLEPDGSARVSRQPQRLPGSRWPPNRLAFAVRMPRRGGTARLRCNLYWNHLLIQSRLVEVTVTRRPKQRDSASRSVMDFRLADPTSALARQDPARFAASLQLDEDAKGTHGLRVFADVGGEPLRAEATITGSDIGTRIALARSALHRVAWGADTEWRDGLEYRYREPAGFDQLAGDLVTLAVNGFRLYHLLVRGLAASAGRSVYDMARDLRRTMHGPSYVQIALRQAAQRVLPAGMLYDLPLDTQADRLRVCAEFERAAGSHTARCLQGACRQAMEPDDTVVCPGGFWGYRHALGLPVSVGTAAALPSHLDGRAGTRVTGGVYRDFQLVDEHQVALGALLPRMRMRLADTRPDTLRELRATQPHLVYFYCHGGVSRTVPYLRVGTGNDGPVITPDNLFNSQIRWDSHRPLVFLNGCRTTGLSPENAVDFVNFFVQDAWACGVIGTEITVFEPLATAFAEECLRGFVSHGLPIGAAVRQARIALLARHNPLGLAYVPFVSPTIRFLRDQ